MYIKKIKPIIAWAAVSKEVNELMLHWVFQTRKLAYLRSKAWTSDGGEKLKVIKVKITPIK